MKCSVHPCTVVASGMTTVVSTFDMAISDDVLIMAEDLAGVKALYSVRLSVGFCDGHIELLGIDPLLLTAVPA